MQITIKGDKKAYKHLMDVVANLNDMSDAFESIGGFYRTQVLAQFQEHGFVPGVHGPWSPLDSSTIETKLKNKNSPLIAQGELVRSLTIKADPYNINEIDLHKSRFGTKDPIALFHQGGTRKNGKKHIPTRSILLGNNIMDDYIVHAIAKHLFRGWGVT